MRGRKMSENVDTTRGNQVRKMATSWRTATLGNRNALDCTVKLCTEPIKSVV